MKDYNIYNISDTCEIEANYFAAQLLVNDEEIIDYAAMGYTSSQIAAKLNVHEELILMKANILNRQGYKFNISYIPDSNYLGKK
jgi:Zn-dependent peptidase ImmA (M78 family)